MKHNTILHKCKALLIYFVILSHANALFERMQVWRLADDNGERQG